MAIGIRSITYSTTASNPITTVTSESPAATQVGDLVVVIHGNDFYALSNMPTPTATGSPAVTAVTGGAADGGSNEAHVKAYTYTANTGGAQTVSVTETGSADEEKCLIVYVLSGANTGTPIDVAGNNATAANEDPWVLSSVSPTSTDAFLIAHVNTNAVSSGVDAVPGSMTQQYRETTNVPKPAGATEQLSASGATDTRSFDATVSRPWAGVLIAINTSSAVAPDQNQALSRPFVGPVPRLFRTGVRAPFQLMGDATSPTSDTPVSLTDTGTGTDLLSSDATVPLADTGAGADALTVAATVSLADTGAGADELTVSVPVSLTEDGAGVDLLSVTGTIPLDDTGTGVDSLTVTVTALLDDTGVGVDALSVQVVGGDPDPYQAVPQVATMFLSPSRASLQLRGDTQAEVSTTPQLPDTGSAAENLSITATVPLAETGTGIDQLSVVVPISLSDTGSAVDTLTVAATVPLTDTGSGVDVLSITATIPLSDTGAGADELSLSGTPISLPETATGTDVLTITSVTFTMADTAAAVDAISIPEAPQLTVVSRISTGAQMSRAGTGTDARRVATGTQMSRAGTGTDARRVSTGTQMSRIVSTQGE